MFFFFPLQIGNITASWLPTVLKEIYSCWHYQNVPLSITDTFAIDQKEKVSLIDHNIVCDKTRTFFVDLSQTFMLLKCRHAGMFYDYLQEREALTWLFVLIHEVNTKK